ncbi:MAG TPA: NYN domain-containing protein [Hyphomicrobiaceae bacterium]|nr:NYN domain-containing protein [Hyphomicrobiaceae bacterium]
MQRESSGPILSAVFVDYDNIYLSLKRKNEDAAKRFAKDAALWVKKIEIGALITPTNTIDAPVRRRLVMNRCYGNPVPRRNQSDNSTDMNSFPFVRHHFLRSGFEVVDCPPLTAQLKNSSDIRMVMDIRDYLDHKTNFDEFIILSSDADFTPVLHRLRSHAKRTVIFANDHTATPYTALSDGEVREADLIAMLLGELEGAADAPQLVAQKSPAETRKQIIDEVVRAVLEASTPQPLEALADKATRALGHDATIGNNWAGAGSFRELLLADLPDNVRLTEQAPFLAYDVSRAITHATPPAQRAPKPELEIQTAEPAKPSENSTQQTNPEHDRGQEPSATLTPSAEKTNPAREATPDAELLQKSIARIHEACQAPPISPPEYRALFNVLAQEISENQLQGVKTLENAVNRAKDLGIEIERDDVRFVLDVVSEPDPWFENGASAKLFAGRFRNFVVARCRSQGLNLSADELDLIDAWFAGGTKPRSAAKPVQPAEPPATQPPAVASRATRNWWDDEPGTQLGQDQGSAAAQPQQRSSVPPQNETSRPLMTASTSLHGSNEFSDPDGPDMDDFPRIVRNRLRG